MIFSRRRRFRLVATGLVSLLGSGIGLADHIPSHDECDPTFPMPIPGADFFTGGIAFVTLIGPVEGTQITNTRYNITYISDGATPASELQLALSVQVNSVWQEFVVTGADLGFGSGPGTFTGNLETDFFNGLVWQFNGFPHSIADLEISAVKGGIEGVGYFFHSAIVFDVIPAPPCTPVCPADLNVDNTVGPSDLALLLGAWGACAGCGADVNGNGSVDAADLALLLGDWGPC